MLLRAVLFATLVLAAMGMATRIEHLVILRLAQGMFYRNNNSNPLHWSLPIRLPIDYPMHLAFLSSSTFIGMSAGPAIGGFIAESFGYRVSFFIGAGLMLIDFFVALLLIKEGDSFSRKQHMNKYRLPQMYLLLHYLPALLSPCYLFFFLLRVFTHSFSPRIFLYMSRKYLTKRKESPKLPVSLTD